MGTATRLVQPHERPSIRTKLLQWMEENEVAFSRLARNVGTTLQFLHQLAHGRVLPDLLLAFDVERITKGVVPASYWLGLPVAREKQQERKRQAMKAKSKHLAPWKLALLAKKGITPEQATARAELKRAEKAASNG